MDRVVRRLGERKLAKSTVYDTYGFLPTSVWDLPYQPILRVFSIERSRDIKKGKSKGYDPKAGKYKDYSEIRYSIFNPELAKRVIRLWSEEGDTILDPFMGRETRPLVALGLKRNYIGYEVVPRTVKLVVRALEDTLYKHSVIDYDEKRFIFTQNGVKQDINLASGVELKNHIDKPNSVDLIFTCPPYYNIEKYDYAPDQLSLVSSYEAFLKRLSLCVKNTYKVLKHRKFSIWVVADFRESGMFRAFHKDLIDLHLKHKFTLHDIIISVLSSPTISRGIRQAVENYYTAKRHEYILVFRK